MKMRKTLNYSLLFFINIRYNRLGDFMKKTISILFILLMLTACGKQDPKEPMQKEEPTPIPSPTPTPYVDENPVTVGLYQNGKLIHNLDTSITNGVDIASFDVYFTNEENTGSANTKYNFNRFYNNYEDASKYKIGFYLSFKTNEKTYEATITKPNVYATTPYIYNYLYDDINQPDGAWYSHVENSDVKDNTIYSSIKLYAAEKTEEIISPITLMVFTYDTPDDFDQDGNYHGKSKYTITINKK